MAIGKIQIDKIPIEMFSEMPGEETFRLGTIELTKGEYANAEKINDIIEALRELQDIVTKMEDR